LALGKCLSKYAEILKVVRKIESVLEEDENSGQWKKRRHELEREARRRIPDFQVVIAFSQKAGDHVDARSIASDTVAINTPPNKVCAAMLAESSTRLLWLYHLCLSSVVAEARFDVGKALQNSFGEVGMGNFISRTPGWDTLRRLHVLRLLKESDQFVWTGKSGEFCTDDGASEPWLMTTGTRSYINILLSAYVSISVVGVRDVIGTLLRRLLSESILFEHDPEEVYFWLSSLPLSARSKGTGPPNCTLLLDEQNAVISFLDDCIQVGLKMPYGYIEEIADLSHGPTANNDYQDGGNAPSPLLAAIMEQVFARVSASNLRPLDILAIVSFVRKLLVRLSGKEGSMEVLLQLSKRLASLSLNNDTLEEHAMIRRAITREIEILKNYLLLLRDPTVPTSPQEGSSSSVGDFLHRIENMPIRTSQLFLRVFFFAYPTFLATSDELCQSSAFELIDCARSIDAPLWREAIMRLISTISGIRRLTVGELLGYLDTGQRLLQDLPFFVLLKQICSKWVSIPPVEPYSYLT